MGDVGAPELLVILAVVLLLFGGAKLPELARSLGKAKKEFQKGVDEGLPDSDHAPLRASASEHVPDALPPVAPATPVVPEDRSDRSS